MTEPNVTEGQPAAEPAGTTDAGTGGQTEGQPVSTPAVNPQASESSFFDYETIKGKPELEAAYKEMQRAFSRKTQGIADHRSKIDQYDQFMRNPVESMQQLARQYGYHMVQGEPDQTDKQFKNWDDVMGEAKRQVMQELQPMIGELQSMKKQNVEQMLDNAHPDWRTYEDRMIENLQRYPQMADDPDLLYRISIPREVLEARASKAALARLQNRGDTVSGQSTTTQQPAKTPVIKSFNDAVAAAKAQLGSRGIARPANDF